MGIPVRQLRNQYGALLARVAAGETIEVEQGGRVVATLGPPARDDGVPRARIAAVFAHAEHVDVVELTADLYGPDGFDDAFGPSRPDAGPR